MKILTVFGTRPEAIKMAPVIAALNADPRFDNKVCLSGQHRSMLDQVINFFDIPVEYDLNVMQENQSLSHTTAAILSKVDDIIKQESPDCIMVHGDTNTTMSVSLAAFFNKVRIAHIEAGLRTNNLLAPWPEEANRRITDLLAHQYFAPTNTAKHNLEQERILSEKITVTGNTVIDALFMAQEKITANKPLQETLDQRFSYLNKDNNLILVTGHRRENHGDGLTSICHALMNIADNNPVDIIYPVHKNPNVKDIVHKHLGGKRNIHLIEPLGYPDFVYLMNQSYLILTDSGGIQEEAPSLNKPVLVMREVTERPEGIEAGTLKLVGTHSAKIVENVHTLLKNKDAYFKMANARNPYGDGKAAKRIIDALYTGQ